MAIIPGRTFTRRMYTKYSFPNLKQHYHINVDRELKGDCLVWLVFLVKPEAVCRPFIDFTSNLGSDVLDFFTDTSYNGDLGFGCVFGRSWTYGAWEGFVHMFKVSVAYLELYAIAIAITLWSYRL